MTGCVNITPRTLRKLATHCTQLKLLRLGVQQVEEVRQRKGGGRVGGVAVGMQQVQEVRHMEGGQGRGKGEGGSEAGGVGEAGEQGGSGSVKSGKRGAEVNGA